MDEIEYKTNPVKAIRAKCLDCCCFQPVEVEKCPAKRCPIWPFRFGKNPYRTKREVTDAMREALQKAWDARSRADAPDS